MNIDDLTLGQVKELTALFGAQSIGNAEQQTLNRMVGKKVIIRTYSAGVWFGQLVEKSGNEVILERARRMYRWHAAESISLSAVATYGINQEKSKICEAVGSVWLEAIEIIPCTDVAVGLIEGAKNVKAE